MKKNEIVVCTSAFCRQSITGTLQSIKSEGVTRISLWGGIAHCLPEGECAKDKGRVRKLARELGLQIVEFYPETYANLYNPADENDVICRMTKEYYRRCVIFCSENDIPYIVVRPGKRLLDLDSEHVFQCACQNIKEIADNALEWGVTPVILHGDSNYFSGLTGIGRLYDALGNSKIKLALSAERLIADGEACAIWTKLPPESIAGVRISGIGRRMLSEADIKQEKIWHMLNEKNRSIYCVWDFDNRSHVIKTRQALAEGLSILGQWNHGENIEEGENGR